MWCGLSEEKKSNFLKLLLWDFPGGSVVKNLPASAGDTGSIPDLGRFHMPRSNQVHIPQPLSLCFTTDAAAATRSLCTTPGEGPPSPQLEKTCVQQQSPGASPSDETNSKR